VGGGGGGAGSRGGAPRDGAAGRAEAAHQGGESRARAKAWVAEDKPRLARQELVAARARIGNERAALGALADEVDALDTQQGRFERFLERVDQAHDAEIPQPVEPPGADDVDPGMAGRFQERVDPDQDAESPQACKQAVAAETTWGTEATADRLMSQY